MMSQASPGTRQVEPPEVESPSGTRQVEAPRIQREVRPPPGTRQVGPAQFPGGGGGVIGFTYCGKMPWYFSFS